jgi:hypothetical protein
MNKTIYKCIKTHTHVLSLCVSLRYTEIARQPKQYWLAIRMGATVMVGDREKPAATDGLLYTPVDVTNIKDMESLAAEALSKMGSIDMWCTQTHTHTHTGGGIHFTGRRR